ncbi:MAG: hypothetical protein K6G61_05505 [Solobacterium sp.]|nr:hypothetical protein [Solobacterium sp.]
MKRLIKILTSIVMVMTLASCTKGAPDLSVLRLAYNQVGTVELNGDRFDNDYLDPGKFTAFVSYMNAIQTLKVAEEEDIPEQYLSIRVKSRNNTYDIGLACPYIMIDETWFYAEGDDLKYLESFRDVIYSE